jgi:hypothetical protein
MGQTIYVLLGIAVTLLPIIFHRNKMLRIACVLALLLNALALVHFGLHMASRNVPLPPQAILRSQANYSDAWGKGLENTQQKVDACIPGIALAVVLLAILAIFPMVNNRPANASHSS